MIDLNALNPQQRQGVTAYEGPTLILAGAGTGKTRVVTSRIGYMLDNGIAADSIAAMTFTNKAAREMKERVAEIAGARARKVRIGTFHSFCIHILRRFGKHVGLGDGFTLIGTSDQLDLVTKSIEEKMWSRHFKADDFLSQISDCKNWLISPEDLHQGKLPRKTPPDPPALAEIYDLYSRRLRLNRAIDFDDCIYKVVTLLRENPEVKEMLQEQYQYILVDEFQDTNYSQFAVIEELASGHNNVCVVGDDDQSIYSWRGAMYETIDRFEKTFPGTRLIKLEQNYRCTNIILDAANSVIQNNTLRKKKTLWSASSDETPIQLATVADAVEEARWVAERCIQLIGSGHSASEIAILYRSNSQAKLLEMALRECSIPYKTFGGQSFFERAEIKHFLSFLRLVASPDDRLALWKVINYPPRGIGLKTQEKIDEISKEKDRSPFATLALLNGGFMQAPEAASEGMKPKALAAIGSFHDAIQDLRDLPLSTPEDLLSLGEEIIKAFGLDEDIRRSTANATSKQHKLRNLRSMPAWLQKSGKDMLADEGVLNGHELLDRLTLSESPSESKDEKNDQQVSLMTIHAAKGLEFPAVFVVGCEESLLPHKNSVLEPNGLAEERRLFYVALTRAKQKLHLSSAAFRQTGFQKESRIPSRFLGELPEGSGNIERIKELRERAEETQKDRRKATVSRLSKIRESLLNGELT